MTDSIFVCEAPGCAIQYYKVDDRFKMRDGQHHGMFCLGCVGAMKEQGWVMKSRESLERFNKLVADETYYPFVNDPDPVSLARDRKEANSDLHRLLLGDPSKEGKPAYADEEDRRRMKVAREQRAKKDLLGGNSPSE